MNQTSDSPPQDWKPEEIRAVIESLGNMFLHRCTDQRLGSVPATNISQWQELWFFLETIDERYRNSNDVYLARIKAQGAGTAENAYKAMLLLQLEIESFYHFAKRLMDRIAETVTMLFDFPLPGRGSAHSELTAEFDRLLTRRGLDRVPLRIGDQIADLKKRIIPFRNRVLEHQWSPFMTRGVALSPDDPRA